MAKIMLLKVSDTMKTILERFALLMLPLHRPALMSSSACLWDVLPSISRSVQSAFQSKSCGVSRLSSLTQIRTTSRSHHSSKKATMHSSSWQRLVVKTTFVSEVPPFQTIKDAKERREMGAIRGFTTPILLRSCNASVLAIPFKRISESIAPTTLV